MMFEEFVKKVDNFFMSHQATRSKPSEPISVSNQLRYGQALMNVLYDVWPEKYIEIRDTVYDCFYSNKHIDLTIDKLKREWNEKVS